ncbi:MAG: cupin domain-containing protein [Bacteroidales bacterium]|jgi:mannose-6-phosphate isomerase-like protein (cupin superfamily)
MNPFDITHLENASKVPFALNGKILFTSDKLEVVHLTLKAGEKMESHSQPFDVIFFVIEGMGSLEINNNHVNVGANSCVHVNKGMLRSWANTGKSNLKILIIKELT